MIGTAMGSSPRVRSRPSMSSAIRPYRRIISACAEQTVTCRKPAWWATDHLRVCGADVVSAIGQVGATGSSPRVRSRPRGMPGHRRRPGIISACAEQTAPTPWGSCAAGDHLRVCGADLVPPGAGLAELGSSPRVRSRPRIWKRHAIGIRIISACAEQTSPVMVGVWPRRDHLRVCGADSRSA